MTKIFIYNDGKTSYSPIPKDVGEVIKELRAEGALSPYAKTPVEEWKINQEEDKDV